MRVRVKAVPRPVLRHVLPFAPLRAVDRVRLVRRDDGLAPQLGAQRAAGDPLRQARLEDGWFDRPCACAMHVPGVCVCCAHACIRIRCGAAYAWHMHTRVTAVRMLCVRSSKRPAWHLAHVSQCAGAASPRSVAAAPQPAPTLAPALPAALTGGAAAAWAAARSSSSVFSTSRTSLAPAPRSGVRPRSLTTSGFTPSLGSSKRSARTAARMASSPLMRAAASSAARERARPTRLDLCGCECQCGPWEIPVSSVPRI